MSDELDLSKYWIPEMLAFIEASAKENSIDRLGKPRSEETKERISKALAGRPSGMSGKTQSRESKEKISKALLGKPKPPFSKEHRDNMSKAMRGKGHPQSSETKEKLSRILTGRTLSEEHKRHMSEANMGKAISGETRKKHSEASKKWWAGLSEEERSKFLKEGLHSPKSVLNRMKACRKKPTMPELSLEAYLEQHFPNEWAYNGDGSQNLIIGRKVPDFINIGGKKEVVEVLGGIGYFHFLDEEEEKIACYRKNGYKCIVVFEWDCYNPKALNKIFNS
jgi:hypothetical protein